MKKRIIRMIVVVLLCLLLATSTISSARATVNPGILPPNARVQGMTLGQYNAIYFQRLLGIPVATNPAFNLPSECYFTKVGNVGMAVVQFGGNMVLNCTMPTGMMLYVFVIGSECSTLEAPPFYGGNEAELRDCALSTRFENVGASVDGVEVNDIEQYLKTTPLYKLTLPPDNVAGVPAGTGDSVGYAYSFILTPFSPGKHTLHVQGVIPPDFVWNGDYNITVTR